MIYFIPKYHTVQGYHIYLFITRIVVLQFCLFLQFGRYSALLLGIMWGSHRFRVNKAAEDAWRAEEAERKVIRDAQKAEEKLRLNREELLYLAKQAGVKVPPNF